MKKVVIIIGAGPAGLTAAYELLQYDDAHPIVLEATDHIGGISKTVCYKGNRIDIGGHRFFSKSDAVMNWWQDILPVQRENIDIDKTEKVMLVRFRRSRIYFLRRFFDYPISLTPGTLANLGLFRTVRIAVSYLRSLLFPIKPELNLEAFFINRFGRELYNTFFKSYTEKVWGVPCISISSEWGAQRIKGLSVLRAVWHILKKFAPRSQDVRQKEVETSLIEQFLYPKYGPGQMWESVADLIRERHGEIHMKAKVVSILREDDRIAAVETEDTDTGERKIWKGQYFISTMPVKDLVAHINPAPPRDVRDVADGLVYRDFISVGLLLRRLKLKDPAVPDGRITDNWIYIQEPDVQVGRLQIFNNWSPYMLKDPENTVWIGLEYFVNEGDALWTKSDNDLSDLAAKELEMIGIIDVVDVLDSVVIREPKAYPAYFGTYDRFSVIRAFTDSIPNLFCVGRNGMHRYNNQDHSMLTAMASVDCIVQGKTDKGHVWSVNAEQEYHEEKGARDSKI